MVDINNVCIHGGDVEKWKQGEFEWKTIFLHFEKRKKEKKRKWWKCSRSAGTKSKKDEVDYCSL